MTPLSRVCLISNDETLGRIVGAWLRARDGYAFRQLPSQQAEMAEKNEIILWDAVSCGAAPAPSASMIVLAPDLPSGQKQGPVLTLPLNLAELAAALESVKKDPAWVDLPQGLRFCPSRRVVEQGGKEAALTDKEAALLSCLLEAGGQPVARDALLQRVWGYATEVESRTLESHLHRLRGKLRELKEDIIAHTPQGYVIG